MSSHYKVIGAGHEISYEEYQKVLVERNKLEDQLARSKVEIARLKEKLLSKDDKIRMLCIAMAASWIDLDKQIRSEGVEAFVAPVWDDMQTSATVKRVQELFDTSDHNARNLVEDYNNENAVNKISKSNVHKHSGKEGNYVGARATEHAGKGSDDNVGATQIKSNGSGKMLSKEREDFLGARATYET